MATASAGLCGFTAVQTHVVSDLSALFCCHIIHSVIHRSKVETFYFGAVFFLGEKENYVSHGPWMCELRDTKVRVLLCQGIQCLQ